MDNPDNRKLAVFEKLKRLDRDMLARGVGTVQRRFYKRVITMFARAKLPWATAQMVKYALHTVHAPPPEARGGNRRYRVLLLSRAGFNEDVAATLKAAENVECVEISRAIIKGIADAFLPRDVDDNNYGSASPTAQAGMVRYRAFLKRLWRALDPYERIDAVLTANFGYYAEQELASMLEELGVPFIVLHKENAWTPSGQAFWKRVYRERRKPFQGRCILVYNTVERDMQIDAGIVDSGRIEVVGMPRLDAVHHWREANAGLKSGPCILFASFLPTVGLPLLPRKGRDRNGHKYNEVFDEEARELSVGRLCREVHAAIVDLAHANPGITVWVKTKGRASDRSEILRLLGVTDHRLLPANLRIVHGGSVLDLLYQSAVVCGFHSTVLLEAMAAGRPTVVPWFAEALDPRIRPFLLDLGPAVTRVGSSAELTETLRQLAINPVDMPVALRPEVEAILLDKLGNADGRAGRRAWAAIVREFSDKQLVPAVAVTSDA